MILCLLVAGCAGPRYWSYEPRPGRSAAPTASGHAEPPRNAPPAVLRALAAGNQIVGTPYKFGGGHASTWDSGYDCSGAVSRVLIGAGLLAAPRPSSGFRDFGEPGEGEWITVYVTRGHSFIEVADLRFDTGWHRHPEGPRWSARRRPLDGYIARHPKAL